VTKVRIPGAPMMVFSDFMARSARKLLRFPPLVQGLTLVHFSAQRKRFL